MGYSCNAISSFTLEALFELMKNVDEKSSNVFYVKGYPCFYERGKEQVDGSITGTIQKATTKVEIFTDGFMVLPAGSFKIDSDGNVVRFYGSTKEQRIEARAKALIKYHETFGRPYGV